MKQVRIGIVGATGYTGSELVRILSRHPYARVEVITSMSRAGEAFSDVHPAFRGVEDRTLVSLSDLSEYELDIVFLALPNGASMEFVRDRGIERFRVIDLSGDFRLRSPAVYEEWYGRQHVTTDQLSNAAYGLPELYRSVIRSSRLVANPGCYSTSAILLLAPLLKHRLVRPTGIVIDSKSGVTGAGSVARAGTHFPWVFGNFRAYGLLRHRHTPEIEQVLSESAGQDVQVQFTPHLLPIDRGILTTAYAEAVEDVKAPMLEEVYRTCYGSERFIRILNSPPSVKNVRASNFCDIFATLDSRTNRIIAISAIDNLVKGASGQAVQNMNIMFDLPEEAGLEQVPLSP
jgi:N-acetyl-gamma-glutamyl-phosphate reductase